MTTTKDLLRIVQSRGQLYIGPPLVPMAMPGITGKLISKSRLYRRSFVKAQQTDNLGGVQLPQVCVLGSKVFFMWWYGPDPHTDEVKLRQGLPATMQAPYNQTFFVGTKEVTEDNARVQEALDATISMVSMNSAKHDNGYGSFGLGNAASTASMSSSPYVTSSAYWQSNYGHPLTYTTGGSFNLTPTQTWTASSASYSPNSLIRYLKKVCP